MSFPSPGTFPSPHLYPAGLEGIRSAPSGEIEILVGRRAFAAAQELFAGGPVATSRQVSVGWHDTSVSAETGSFAVVAGDQDDLVGEVIRVLSNGRAVFAYVLDSVDVPVQVSLTRRLFLALNRLTHDAIPADVVAVG